MPDFNFSEITKKGWHPKGKDGKSKESWRGDFKGLDQISGWMGKKTGGDSSNQDGVSGGDSAYTPMPISSLRDPASFAPPPKRTGTAGRVSPGTNPGGRSTYTGSATHQPELQPEEMRAEPQPYRRDTTGLSTSHLPPPPGRRDGANGKLPAPTVTGRPPAMKSKPSLPPRLPPRQTDHVDEYTPAAPPPYSVQAQTPAHQGILNQGTLNRLGAAGVSVHGFGIAPSPSPPLPSRCQSVAPPPVSPQKPAPSQLDELQSRFAKFNTTSSPNKASQPVVARQGTTWAQKQAALRTASSFRNDPTSVSFSDVRAAASTANNFREGHGAQIASGLQSANNINNKYGLADKARAAAPHGVGNTSPARLPVPANDQINGMNLDGNAHYVAAKRAPPPPPKKRPDLLGTQQSSGPPPPIPTSSKPKPPDIGTKPSHKATAVPTDFDLNLKSEWYAKSPPAWPPPHLKNNKQFRFNGYSTSWVSYDGHRHTNFTGVIVHSSLAKSKIHISYDGAEPRLTARAEQVHHPPPKPLNCQELEAYRRMYNEKIAEWCENQKGSQVGNGECWTLANDALKSVAEDCKKHGEEECMACIGFVHGYLLYEQQFGHEPHVGEAGITRGDVVQFYEAKFEGPYGWKAAGSPDHTAIVVGLKEDGALKVLEQNNGVDRIVREGQYNLAELTEGEVRVFRPVGTSWLGDLSPNWP